MNTMACRAVARAGLSAATASLDDEAAWPLLLVAGWLTTASELVLESVALAADELAFLRLDKVVRASSIMVYR